MAKKVVKKPIKKKRPAGNPNWKPFYGTPQKVQAMIEEYIKNCPDTRTMFFKLKDEVIEREMPCPTITGLVLYLGFSDRHSFYDYEKKPKFTHTIKKGRVFIENIYEQLLQMGNPSGAIFALKNFGWTDKSDIEMYGKDGKDLFPKPIMDVSNNNGNSKDKGNEG